MLRRDRGDSHQRCYDKGAPHCLVRIPLREIARSAVAARDARKCWFAGVVDCRAIRPGAF